MKEQLNSHRTGLIVGLVFALFHLVWAMMVAGNVAQAWLDWVLGMHFLNNPMIVGQFNITTTLILVVMTFVFGYIFGWVYALVHNWAHQNGKKRR